VRAGDFFGAGRGSWFDLVIVKELASNRITYPGPLNVIHEWAYVPDLAATLVKVAAIRDRLEPFETFGFSGHAVTGQELKIALEKATGFELTVKPIWWPMMRAVGLVMPLARELAEISYLWQRPHRISGNKLRAAIGDIPHTPFAKAIRNALDDLESKK
jgi:nucleoside-diphosphate-sugar epimerase